MAFYDSLFDKCLKYGIEPVVTLSYYEMPLHLAQKWNGWTDRRTVVCFEKYAATVFERYQYKVKYWLTFNEITSVVNIAYANAGVFSKDLALLEAVSYHEMLASAKVVQLAHEKYPQFQMGCMISYAPPYPNICSPADGLAAVRGFDQYTNYYGDVMVRGYLPEYKLKVLESQNLTLPIQNGDLEQLHAAMWTLSPSAITRLQWRRHPQMD